MIERNVRKKNKKSNAFLYHLIELLFYMRKKLNASSGLKISDFLSLSLSLFQLI